MRRPTRRIAALASQTQGAQRHTHEKHHVHSSKKGDGGCWYVTWQSRIRTTCLAVHREVTGNIRVSPTQPC